MLETARGGLLRAGMGYRYCDVAAVLNVQSDHLGLSGVDTLEQLAEVKRIVVEVARDTAVLNADDPLCLEHGRLHRGQAPLLRDDEPRAPAGARAHPRRRAGRVVLEAGINGQMITIYDRGAHIPLLWTHLIPATLEGRRMHNVQNAMFAAAMAFSMGVKLEDIRHGLRTFDTTFFQAPGRMNVFDEHPFKVILDYGHNPAAVEVMCQLVDRLDVDAAGRSWSWPGPATGATRTSARSRRPAAGRFDHYICRRDDRLRGRADDEVPRMLRDALLAAGVPAEQIDADPRRAARRSTPRLRMARPGDLLLVFGDAGAAHLEAGHPLHARDRSRAGRATAGAGLVDGKPRRSVPEPLIGERR